MAARLAISWRALQEYRKRRLVPYVKLGHLVRYDPEAVFAAIDQMSVEATALRPAPRTRVGA